MKYKRFVLSALFISSLVFNIYCYQQSKLSNRWVPEKLIGLSVKDAIVLLGIPDDLILIKGQMNWVDEKENKLLKIVFNPDKVEYYSDAIIENSYIKDIPYHSDEKEKALQKKYEINNLLKSFYKYSEIKITEKSKK